MPEQVLDLFLDVTSYAAFPCKFTAKAGGTQTITPQFTQGDVLPIRLWLCRPAQGYGAQPTIETTNRNIVLCLRARRDDTSPLLTQTGAWTLNTTPDGPCYTSTLNLNTAEILALFSGTEKTVEAAFDLAFASLDGTQLTKYLSPARIARRVYTPETPDTAPALAQYPAPDALVTNQTVTSLVDSTIATLLPPAIAAIPRINDAQAAVTTEEDLPELQLITAPDADNPQNLRITIPVIPGPQGERGADGVVSSVPMGAAAAEIDLTPGDAGRTGTVTLPASMADPALYQIFATLIAPQGTQTALTVQVSNKQAGSFDYELSDSVPAGESWKLSYVVISHNDDASAGFVLPEASSESIGGIRLSEDLTWSQINMFGQPSATSTLRPSQQIVGGYFHLSFDNSAPTSGTTHKRIDLETIFSAAGVTFPAYAEAFFAIGFSFTATLCTQDQAMQPRLFVQATSLRWLYIDWTGISVPANGAYAWIGFGINWIATWRIPAPQV